MWIVGWIMYSLIVLGLLISTFILKGMDVALLIFIGLAIGCWGGAMFPWRGIKYKG